MPTSSVLMASLAVAAVLAVVTLLALIARAAHRRDRRARRAESHAFRVACTQLVREGRGDAEVRRLAAALDERTFWGAVERLSLGLGARARARLGETLERSRHVTYERRALRDDSPWRAELGARRLALLPARRPRRALRRAMVDGNGLTAYAAARALGRSGDRAALRWVLEHPRRFERRGARAWTALLASFGRRALADLAAALERAVHDAPLERALVETLGLGSFGPAGPAIGRRLGHPDPEVRVAAARALGRLRAAASADALLAALADDAWPVRAQSAWALGRLGDERAVMPLTARLADRAWWVRRHAAYALAQLGPAGRAALRNAAESASDRYARDMAHEALEGGFLKAMGGD